MLKEDKYLEFNSETFCVKSIKKCLIKSCKIFIYIIHLKFMEKHCLLNKILEINFILI